jgi:protein-disulfide isomerase
MRIKFILTLMPEKEVPKKHLKIRINVWQALTLIFAVLFVGALLGKIPSLGPQISSSEAASKAVSYINSNLIQTGSVSLVSVKESGGLYNVTVNYQNQNIPVYLTKDGTLLFVSMPIDITKSLASTPTTTSTQAQVKAAKPAVDLYVMSFCPYGTQAEGFMKPVVDLLGSKADIEIKFISTVATSSAGMQNPLELKINGTSYFIDSLHGPEEANEDLRQECIMKYYPVGTYWNYVQNFDNNCPSLRGNDTAVDNCWKNAASQYGIDITKIQTCANGSEGLGLLQQDAVLTNQYGISGSPTLLINGVLFSGSRSSTSYQQAICSSFTTPPAECSQTVTSTNTGTAAASGGCG